MSIEEFILRIHACKGIGRAVAFKIYQFILRTKCIPKFEDLVQLLDRKVAIANDIQIKLSSKETTKRLQETLAFSNYITIFDKAYPQKLREIYQAPLVLFYRGNLELLRFPSLAVVGAR